MAVTDAEIEVAAQLLRGGQTVVFPTETVYGLGAHALMPEAVARIYTIKGRPQDNPLIVHLCSVDAIGEVASAVPDEARSLFERFSPGPLTVVLPASPALPPAVSAGLGTVAIRIPRHPVAQKLLLFAGVPVAAPSANRSGEPSPTTVDMARRSLGAGPAAYLDGGPCEVGLESTVIRVTGGEIVVLRPGAVTISHLQQALPGIPVRRTARRDESAHSPGTRHRHYTPAARVVVFRGLEELRECLATVEIASTAVLLPAELAAGGELPGVTMRTFASLSEYARNLYGWFVELDDAGVKTIYAFLPDPDEIGDAIADRLLRAAAS